MRPHPVLHQALFVMHVIFVVAALAGALVVVVLRALVDDLALLAAELGALTVSCRRGRLAVGLAVASIETNRQLSMGALATFAAGCPQLATGQGLRHFSSPPS